MAGYALNVFLGVPLLYQPTLPQQQEGSQDKEIFITAALYYFSGNKGS